MLKEVSLDDKYDQATGHIFLTGIQALVRLPLLQRKRDDSAGLNTAGFICGYRGSPLAMYDLQLQRAGERLEENKVRFHPGLNEDLALTAVWGSQQAQTRNEGKFDGVFAIWYGKGAGIDRSGDALRHGSLSGAAENGGVLMLLGDDHRAESSSVAHQSEFTMMDYQLPVLNPADVRDVLDFGLFGFALSRFSGCWVSMKCGHEVIESAASIPADYSLEPYVIPHDFTIPPGGLNLRVPDTPHQQEARHPFRLEAAQAFARANNIDRVIGKPRGARVGIVTTGKPYLDVLEALDDLGMGVSDDSVCPVALYKVGMPWPLEPKKIMEFCDGLDCVIVVEEKRAVIEPQLKALLFHHPDAPHIAGKQNRSGACLLPETGTLSSNRVGVVIADEYMAVHGENARLSERKLMLQERERVLPGASDTLKRLPHYCSGCPHNRSTIVPEGGRGMAGTGCNYMVMWMDRRTDAYAQMGADGANWIGEAPFSRRKHVFQNMGDGTYYHSGILSIRASVAAKVNITYKILFNGTVAMTGGQAHDGPISVDRIVGQVLAEGVAKVVVVTEDPSRYKGRNRLPQGVAVHHRDALDKVQRELQETPGTTVLVYDQMCATERRRMRKRGLLEDPAKFTFINKTVCEGCGDCGVQSNCVSILPVETVLGRKREIDQSSCNKDFSCVNGFCPSFVTLHGGRVRKPEPPKEIDKPLPYPVSSVSLDKPYGIVLAGVGGTGVLTISAILGMAAHLESKGCTVLDMTGLAQKGGAVTSHIRITATPEGGRSARIPAGAADLALGCDLMTLSTDEPLSAIGRGRTHVIANLAESMIGEFTRNPDLKLPQDAFRARVEAKAGENKVDYLQATQLSKSLLGDTILTNTFMLGYAFQKGLIPLSAESIERAFELNGVSVQSNITAFRAGRLHALRPAQRDASDHSHNPSVEQTPEEAFAYRVDFLAKYQNPAYADRYRKLVEEARRADARAGGNGSLSTAVIKNYFKLLAYKDEYEVARLFVDEAFNADLSRQFEGDYRIKFHFAPPLLARKDPATGRPRKMEFGGWVLPILKALATMRTLRGTPLDIFGYTAERRKERAMIRDYETLMTEVLNDVSTDNYDVAVQLASVPEKIRGYGPVKLAAMTQAEALQEQTLKQFRNPEFGRPTVRRASAA